MSTKIGLQGELIASSLLLSYGIDNDMVSKDGYDLIAWFGKKPLRVQVKASKKPYCDNGETKFRYNFQTAYGRKKTPYSDEQCDFMVLVALDKRICYFMLPTENKTKKLYDTFVTIENEKKSFKEVVEKIQNLCTCDAGFTHTLP